MAKSKLNRCAHCKSNEDLLTVFSNDGHMYFICRVHKFMLDSLIEEAAKIGVKL
jgi:hypothetical protein